MFSLHLLVEIYHTSIRFQNGGLMVEYILWQPIMASVQQNKERGKGGIYIVTCVIILS